jgi:hypothetical protein
MSLINGDRARANKIRHKRRARRAAMKLMRRVSEPAKDTGDSIPLATFAARR